MTNKQKEKKSIAEELVERDLDELKDSENQLKYLKKEKEGR